MTEERWEHIKTEHPIMVGKLKKIEETTIEPDVIKSSSYDPQVVLFYRFYSKIERGKYLAVVVKWSQLRSFILTAYLTDKIKQGAIVWEKN
ncbi:hypothetical protein HYR54_03780 [Candidatus Acetothermia bacterium]|nr:hypothetical protein [Candidatus Acetothermia bacterium]MBI3659331.1 hypothetical protein [Candidatus Acetothermia bacterium]